MFLKEAVKKILPCSVLEALNAHYRMKQQELISKRNSQVIKELLKGLSPIRLELGAGDRRMEGWTSVDMNDNCPLNLDLTGPIPFPDNSVSMIYSSHLLEHFQYTDLIKLLNECWRILETSGIFSASVPNARIYINAYHNPDNFNPDLFCRYEPAYNFNSKIDYVNYVAYMDGHHRYMFDEENIVVILKEAGFTNVRLREFDRTLDLEVRDFQSIYVKAEK
jgi:predicted SAM-dependent methyltransferase